MKHVGLCLGLFWLNSCAVLHHAQVGDVDDRGTLRPFDVKVSEVGFNLKEAGKVAKAVARSEKAGKTIDSIQAIIGMFQQGPKTGNPVFTDTYAQKLMFKLYEVCPSGKITGLTSIRETRKYPVISGEIVKIIGYCIS